MSIPCMGERCLFFFATNEAILKLVDKKLTQKLKHYRGKKTVFLTFFWNRLGSF